ncbi:hypothetical protein GCM10028895_42020 [Pontibacter rugosus]
MLRKWKEFVRQLKEDIYTLYLASQDPRMPFAAKVMVLITVAYAFSPIDLIPDFIPIIGYFDDLLLLPLGIWLSVKRYPSHCCTTTARKPKSRCTSASPIM